MHPTRLDCSPRRACGVTLVEMVVAMVIVGIVVAAALLFAYPVTQAIDLTVRAELTDSADNALQRMGRDVRLALPNSARVTSVGTTFYLEFLAIRTAGRYRSEGDGPSGGTACGGGDELAF